MFKTVKLCVYETYWTEVGFYLIQFLDMQNKRDLKTIRSEVVKESAAIYSGFKVFNLFLQEVIHCFLQVLCRFPWKNYFQNLLEYVSKKKKTLCYEI